MRRILALASLALAFPCVAVASDGDSDHDGIPDRLDQCANTPAGARVWTSGPWMGCAAGQRRDRDLAAQAANRQNLGRAIVACEDKLSGQLQNRSVYEGSSCAPYAHRIEAVTQPYIAMGRRDLGTPAARMSTAHLYDRLRLCLSTNRSMAQVFDAMDASRCSPYPPAGGWGSGAPRVPTPGMTPPPAGTGGGTAPGETYPGGGYARGVTYTTSGNVSFGTNGTSYIRSGNVTFGSDGTSYIRSGNVTFGSNGVSYIRSGNVIFGSNGTSCIVSGSITTCN